MHITSLDHLVLTVGSIDETITFYERVMGMTAETFAGGRRALQFGTQKINLHPAGNEFEPKANTPLPGSADLCFIAEGSIGDVIAHLKSCGVEIIEGPGPRTGARGQITSVYFRDPDQNLIEVSVYGSDSGA